ncbi:MAG TPA: hypothetical protein PKA95_06870 [Thermomicrobiales bacterium]|nr:hypothetical protein [Thermomicrobiales bacterium]
MSAETTDRRPVAEIDRLLVQSIGRWGFLTAVLVILFDVLLMLGYPFPSALDALRGPVYTVVAVLLLIAVTWVTFLGYRLVTLRVARTRRQIYPVFLPVTAVVASIVGFLLMTAPK